MDHNARPSTSRIGTALVLLGALIVAAAIGALAWELWSTKAPGMEALFKVSGQVKNIDLSAGPGVHPNASLTVDRAGTDFILAMPDADRLPQRDWPLPSVLPGDQVVAWYIPTQPDRTRGTLWQLYRGRLPVIALEDRARLQGERMDRALPWCVSTALAGAALLAVGCLLRRRAPVARLTM
jgi:hypothetical protein